MFCLFTGIYEENNAFSDSEDSLFSSDELDSPQPAPRQDANWSFNTKVESSDPLVTSKAKKYQNLYKETLPEVGMIEFHLKLTYYHG